MPRFHTLLAASAFVAAAADCDAQSAEFKPFKPNDEWTFHQHLVRADQSSTDNTIRFSTLFKNGNGDLILGWARAVTDAGQTVWQPLGKLPASTCIRDFVGKSDLGLPDSCGKVPMTGATWQSSSNDGGETDQLRFRVTGQEKIEVPAGTFDAVKIVGQGTRLKADGKAESLTVSYWFARDAKAMVRAVHEYRSENGKPSATITEELTAYKVH